MDAVTKLKISMLYFLEEAVGYRHSLHWLRRYLETNDIEDFRQLVVQVGREHFVDLEPVIEALDGNETACLALIDLLFRRGMHVPNEWLEMQSNDYESAATNKIITTPVDTAVLALISGNSVKKSESAGQLWTLYNWIDKNKKKYPELNALGLLCYTVETVFSMQDDFNRFNDFIALLLGQRSTVLDTIFHSDLNVFANAVGKYFAEKEWVAKNLAMAILAAPEENWKDALSRNQIKSKKWLLEKLEEHTDWFKNPKSIFDKQETMIVVGGWVGILPFLSAIDGTLSVAEVVNFDIDSAVNPASTALNGRLFHSYKTANTDIRTVDFSRIAQPVIIDTIVEHFTNHSDWLKTLPAGTPVVLQGNDMFGLPDHVNCHHTLDEFVETCGLNTIIWYGELSLPGCTRFMVIGTT